MSPEFWPPPLKEGRSSRRRGGSKAREWGKQGAGGPQEARAAVGTLRRSARAVALPTRRRPHPCCWRRRSTSASASPRPPPPRWAAPLPCCAWRGGGVGGRRVVAWRMGPRRSSGGCWSFSPESCGDFILSHRLPPPPLQGARGTQPSCSMQQAVRNTAGTQVVLQ
jgi:hypothetical protein